MVWLGSSIKRVPVWSMQVASARAAAGEVSGGATHLFLALVFGQKEPKQGSPRASYRTTKAR